MENNAEDDLDFELIDESHIKRADKSFEKSLEDALGIKRNITFTNDEKLKIYEGFFHKINIYCTCMKNEKIADAISLIDSWSYSHRVGNGVLSEEKQQELVDNYIKKMQEY